MAPTECKGIMRGTAAILALTDGDVTQKKKKKEKK